MIWWVSAQSSQPRNKYFVKVLFTEEETWSLLRYFFPRSLDLISSEPVTALPAKGDELNQQVIRIDFGETKPNSN